MGTVSILEHVFKDYERADMKMAHSCHTFHCYKAPDAWKTSIRGDHNLQLK